MAWKSLLKGGSEIILATSSKPGKPNANVAISLGIVDGRVLINDCQMRRTAKNIAENGRACIIAMGGGEYYRIEGTARAHTSGKYFEIGVAKNKPPYKAKSVIAFGIRRVFDLDKGKYVFG